ncbi:MAG: acetyl/propionyl/methylcrotonyl-CoA carboxylase subunit alpha [Alphaproteobacteria bacterium]|nr:MAG: acetyl/propionyl/methylcrotonyl-CoA carboxylase subunit alpha [Alphaproteobacteria bacterium]
MFRKILIANRGEIACRVIATAHRLGVKTVAVYSDADAGARHVLMAGEAVHIGPAPVAESYLRGEAIIAAALETGAEAIHPGYGFLSENPEFVEAVEAAGLVFIGPTAEAIRAMGLKDAAKALMEKAGVPVVPGYHGARQEGEFLAEEAARIGYPVLIKARAGGGGKGMRRVDRPEDFAPALEAAQREAQASFGDPACLIEKFIASPRHIEMQVFGDGHGNVVHLFERDCSLQRRHQKVIEEAPAPGMTPELRAAMGAAAVSAAKAIGYRGAGTVEFIVDGSGPLRPDGFWFMEMNTRLQVEHPVTEAITGLDLVEWQLRVAAGEALPMRQDELAIDGWAFEARLYAEDVAKGFLPATGKLELLDFPPRVEFSPGAVRVDSGVRQGDEISPWYDPMIAKLIVHGPTRGAALNMLAAALEACAIAGSVTNLSFLSALARHEGFRAGSVDTGLIDRDLAALTTGDAPPPHVLALAALGAMGLLRPATGSDPWRALTGWRAWETAEQVCRLDFGAAREEMHVTIAGGGRFVVRIGETALALSITPLEGDTVRVETGERQLRARVVRHGGHVSVFCEGHGFTFAIPDPLSGAETDEAGGNELRAPMPGLVTRVLARAGDEAQPGAPLVTLEAMKMEHTLAAPRAGTVAEVLVAPGDQVSDGALLLRLEPEADD